MAEVRYFVWIKSPFSVIPYPQIWYGEHTKGTGVTKEKDNIVAIHKLTDDDPPIIAELSVKYPAPIVEDNGKNDSPRSTESPGTSLQAGENI